MNELNGFFAALSGYVWGVPLLVLLVGTGLLLTFRLRCLQVRMLGHALYETFVRPKSNEQGDISHFQALMVALAATIGTGNIIGVATAISVGGPGALFWMWITAALGMATKYAEGVLAVKYRVVDENGEMAGGPMYYLERGLGQKWLGVLFALFGSIAAFGIGNTVQANAVAGNLKETFGISPLGHRHHPDASHRHRYPRRRQKHRPGLRHHGAGDGDRLRGGLPGYPVPLCGRSAGRSLAGMSRCLQRQPPQPAAFWAPTIMLAIQKGVSRGVFSNESGMGSAPIAAAAAKTNEPCEQALVSMTGTFIDTIIICTMTGLVLIVTGAWHSGAEVSVLTKSAFDIGLPGNSGGYIVTFGIVFFAYSTIIGWAYYGEKCMEYLLGVKALFPYRLLYAALVMVGATVKLELVWNFADVMNGLMAIPNLIGLLGLSGVVVAETNRFLAERKEKKLEGSRRGAGRARRPPGPRVRDRDRRRRVEDIRAPWRRSGSRT